MKLRIKEAIYLSNYDIIYLGKKAEELGFVRDTLEKVTRLAEMRVSNPNGENLKMSLRCRKMNLCRS